MFMCLIFRLLVVINNLIENYEIILNNRKNTCRDIDGFTQIRKPKKSNTELVTPRPHSRMIP